MKNLIAILMIVCSFAFSAIAAPTGSEQFQTCRKNYDTIIGHIVASSGMQATSTIWRFLFHFLDLDGNEQVTSSEIALYLEKERYVHESDIMDVMEQAAEWIATGDGGDGQLTRDEFVIVVQKTIGQKTDPVSSSSYSEVSSSLCKLFTLKVPHLSETMSELSTCTSSLEKAMLEDESRRAEFNSWGAIFKTMDRNHNMNIDFEEIKMNINQNMNEKDDISLAFALGHAIYGEVPHEVKDISEKDFYVFVHELLYGASGSERKHVWDNVASEEELHGRTIMCRAISDVRKQVTGQRKTLGDCIKTYEETKHGVLGADSIFAPEIVFTIADHDKNGHITEHEFNYFIDTTSSFFTTIQRKNDVIDVTMEVFRTIMPDRFVVARGKGDETNVIEMTALSSHDLYDAQHMCVAITTAVGKFFGDDVTSTNETIDGVTNEESGAFSMPMGSLTFKGLGEHILVEHTLPTETTQTTLPETTTQEEVVTSSTPESESVVYHIVGSDGQPIELSLNRIEIDDIVHRMAAAQQPPIEPEGNPPVALETPQEHQNEPETPEGEALYKEIENLIREEQNRNQEEEDTAQLMRRINASITTSEAPEADVTEPTLTSQTLSAEENELQDLLIAMEGAKLKIKKSISQK